MIIRKLFRFTIVFTIFATIPAYGTFNYSDFSSVSGLNLLVLAGTLVMFSHNTFKSIW